MFNLKSIFLRWRRKRKRVTLSTKLKQLEENHQRNNTWQASLKINCQILSIIEPELLTACNSDYTTLTIYSGFNNVHHLFDWTACVIHALRNRDAISFDMTNIMYQRKKVKLADFCLTHDNKRYPVDALYLKLLTDLTTVIHLFDDIKDPRYADKSSAALEPLWVDVFAVIEMLCTLGVKHEQ